jgi:hypothetical protein
MDMQTSCRNAAVALAGDNGRVIRTADAGGFPFLRAMLFEAVHWRAGVRRPTISLSVDPENAAVRLYERAGFTRVGGARAWTMVAEL